MPDLHQAPDGTLHQFPDGTPDSVIEASMAAYAKLLPNKGLFEYPKEGSQQTSPTLSDIINTGKPFSAIPALKAGTMAAEAMPGPLPVKALAGAAMAGGTYFGLDTALQKIRNTIQGSKEEPSGVETAGQALVQEGGGAAIKGGLRLAKGVLTPAQAALSKLLPTLSQYFENHPIPKAIEDIFSPFNKAASIKRSGALADTAVTQEAQALSGRVASTVNDTETLAKTIKIGNLENSYLASKAESNLQGENFIGLGKVNTVTNEVPNPKFQALLKSPMVAALPLQAQVSLAGKMGISPTNTTIVEGPISLNSTLQEAKRIVDEAGTSVVSPSEIEKPLIKQATRLLSSTNAQFDPISGQLINSTPLPAREAWNLKQEFDNYGGWEKRQDAITGTDKGFQGISKLMSNDIENSILKDWKNQPKEALAAWENSKATVEQRLKTFFPAAKETSLRLGDLIDSTDNVLPKFKEILNDTGKLDKAMSTGRVKFPSGATYTDNIRGGFGAINLKEIWNDARKFDPHDPSIMTIDATKLQNEWKNLSPQIKKRLYSGQTEDSYDNLFKNVAATQEKQNAFGSWIAKATMVRGGLSLVPGLIAGGFTHGLPGAGEAALVELGFVGMAKAMTNPTIARGLAAAIGGQPLAMSDQMFARKLAAAVTGTMVTIVNKDGKRTEGSLNRNGEFEAAP